jgi:hypothetical protein
LIRTTMKPTCGCFGLALGRLALFRFTWCDPIPDRREHLTSL